MTIIRLRWRAPVAVLIVLTCLEIPRSTAQGSAPQTNAPLENRAADDTQTAPGADLPTTTGTKQLTNYAEAGGDYLGLTDGFGHWAGGYARGVVTQGNSTWNGEVNGQYEFGDAGVYLGAGDSYNFNPEWYGSLAIGSSVGGFFWPRFRADGFINKKWMSRKQLITTIGLGYYAAKDVHRDHSFFAGSTYYFTKPWILEGGIRFNVSNPGSVFSPAAFIAVTQGRNQHHYIVVRSGFGKEAFQLIGPTVVLSDFPSQTLTVTWRQWVSTNWGFNLVGDFYHSPFYMRAGASFGFFREF
jgi:YaiO family outer membrane protein